MERQVKKTCDYVVSYAVSVGTNSYMHTSRVRLMQKEDESETQFIDTVCEFPAEVCMRLWATLKQTLEENGVNDFTVCILNYWRDDKSCWGYKENP